MKVLRPQLTHERTAKVEISSLALKGIRKNPLHFEERRGKIEIKGPNT